MTDRPAKTAPPVVAIDRAQLVPPRPDDAAVRRRQALSVDQ
jgi:hypothetical protein